MFSWQRTSGKNLHLVYIEHPCNKVVSPPILAEEKSGILLIQNLCELSERKRKVQLNAITMASSCQVNDNHFKKKSPADEEEELCQNEISDC